MRSLSRPPSFFVASLVLSAALGCGMPRPLAAAGTGACSGCHGNADNAAPPSSTKGLTSTAERAVGAHQQHLRNGALRRAVACGECHLVPATVDAPGHIDGLAEVFPAGAGQLARTGGAAPSWGADGTCSGVYCHGATLGAGGTSQRPQWTQVDGTQAACGTCHAIPPPAPHTSSTACGTCHDGYSATAVDLDHHVDGLVEISGIACAGCHGDATRAPTAANPQLAAAPPADTRGNTSTSTLGVGAHLAHLTDGPLRLAVPCSECHPVPSTLAHVDGVVALAFGPLAQANGAGATFDPASVTCSNACHGAVAPGAPSLGGSIAAPVWTKVDGTQAACGACHGLPPPASQGHPAVAGGLTACAGCHPATVNADGTLRVAGGAHINGVVDVQQVHPTGWSDPTAHGYAANAQGLGACVSCHGADFGGGPSGVSCNACHGSTAWQTSCTFCHGNPGLTATAQNPQLAAAPPAGTQGQQATSARAVGAHQQHLTAGALAPAFACTQCHAVPADLAHVVGGPATMAWGPLAAANGATPSWNGTSCSTYCHGATLSYGGVSSGGTLTTPAWTTVNGSQAACGTCHATTAINTGHHQVHITRGYDCGVCHSGYTATSANPAAHVNGAREVGGAGTSIQSYSSGSCTPSCHVTRSW